MIALRRRIEHLERKSLVFPDLSQIPERETPPTWEELLEMKRESNMPDSVFKDLFGVKDGK
jgi:hypothetical protein